MVVFAKDLKKILVAGKNFKLGLDLAIAILLKLFFIMGIVLFIDRRKDFYYEEYFFYLIRKCNHLSKKHRDRN